MECDWRLRMKKNRGRNSAFLLPKRIGKLLFVFGIAAVVLLAPQSAQSQADFTGLFSHIAPPVVKINTPGVGGGTGFITQYETAAGEVRTGIVTACHVVFDAPRAFGEGVTAQVVNVNFQAWKPDLTLRFGISKCNAANDAALLLPVNENDELVPMGTFFEDLSIERNDPSLRGFPRLYFGDSDDVQALDAVFMIGYPGPFVEFTAVQGRVSGILPVPHIEADSGRVDRISGIVIYDGRPDREIDLDRILSIQTLPALDLEGTAQLALDTLDAGHQILFLSDVQPTGFRITGWDAVGLNESGVLEVQERPIEIDFSLFGSGLEIGPRIESFGTVSLLREFFRLDLPVAGGHSGGPVMNMNGQVIGMVEWGIDSPGGNFANIGNAIQDALFID